MAVPLHNIPGDKTRGTRYPPETVRSAIIAIYYLESLRTARDEAPGAACALPILQRHFFLLYILLRVLWLRLVASFKTASAADTVSAPTMHMHIDIGHHVKARQRNAHFEYGTSDAAGEAKGPLSSHRAPVRSSSLYSNKENANALRPYRSMLDVEAPPTLGPLKSVSLEGLLGDNLPPSASQASSICAYCFRTCTIA